MEDDWKEPWHNVYISPQQITQRDLRSVGSTRRLRPSRDQAGGQILVKGGRVVESHELDAGLVKDDGCLHGGGGGAGKVVVGPASLPRGLVELGDELLGAGRDDFKQIQLAAPTGPAAAVRSPVLGCAGHTGVQGPDGGHVRVYGARVVGRHGEFKEEDLGGAAEALVGRRARLVEAARRVAWLVAVDDEFRVGGDGGGGQHLR